MHQEVVQKRNQTDQSLLLGREVDLVLGRVESAVRSLGGAVAGACGIIVSATSRETERQRGRKQRKRRKENRES
jgi:hypothetical protein